MKVVYITSPSFFDLDLSLVKELRKAVELTVLIDLPSFALHTTALSIESQPAKSGIYPISEIKGFEEHLEFLGEQCFVVNRPTAKRLSLETILMNGKLKRFIKRLNPDLIHFNNPITQYGGSVLRFPAKKLLTIHDPIPHLGESAGNMKVRDWNMKYVKNYLLLNEFQKQDFILRYRLNHEQVHTSFLSSYNSYRSLCNHSDSGEGLNLLFFGRITPYKGLDILIEAFQQLKQIYPKLNLTIAGKGKLPGSVGEIDGLTCLNRYVTVNELATLINNCNLVVCPYIEGTQSGVVMTSFAFSKPVLATKVGGFHEMIEDEVTGFLVEPQSADALKSKLIELIESPELLHVVSRNITAVYQENGKKSWAEFTLNMLKVYETILKQK